jgi:S1-C subfamily serine protease
MRKLALALIVTLVGITFLPVNASSQNPPAPQNTPSKDIELNSILMECTFMLEGRNAQGQPTIGTGFVMGRPLPNTPGRLRYVLITAAHVLNEMVGETMALHLRRKVGENNWVRAPVAMPIRANGQPLWTKHPAADVAVMYISLPTEVSLPLLSTDLLADDNLLSKFEIHPGDELECLGYPFGFPSNAAGFPILRSGKIASYPLLPTAVTKTFLYDFRVFKGNSGGPVYFVQTDRFYGNTFHLGESIHFIAGLVSEEESLSQVMAGFYEQEVRQLQLQLAVVVHASLIKQTVEMLPPP